MPKPKKTAPKTVPLTGLNLVAVVADQSGSMYEVHQDAQRMIRSVFDGFADPPAGQETRLSYYTFNDNTRVEFVDRPAGSVVPGPYSTGGNTALRDAIGQAVSDLKQHPRANEPTTAFMVVVITDGEENQSRSWSAWQIQSLIRDTQATGRWTFVMHCPPHKRGRVAAELGIPVDNIREWERTARGAAEVADTTRYGTQSYYLERSKGATATSAFFVQPDLSKMTPKTVKTRLADLSAKFKQFDMAHEERVDEFVARKTRRPYVIGQAFYQLMKPEKVQPNKEVVLTEVGGTAVWGGPEARAVVGLPAAGDAKVVPGNHAGWNIFIQSRSSNRRLPRGTKLLVDVTRTKGVQPTWEDPAKMVAGAK